MTNFELIKSFDVNSMACMLAQICYERDEIMLNKLVEQGLDVTLFQLSPKLQVEIHKKWLLEEADFSKESEDTE